MNFKNVKVYHNPSDTFYTEQEAIDDAKKRFFEKYPNGIIDKIWTNFYNCIFICNETTWSAGVKGKVPWDNKNRKMIN